MGWRNWVRPPRHLLVLFLGITTVSTTALGWLSWQLVQQDRALAAQRAQDQRDNAASLAATALQKHLADVGDRLAALTVLRSNEIARKVEEYARSLPSDSAILVSDGPQLKAYPSGRLLYYLSPVDTADLPGAQFAVAENLEYQQNDYARASAVLQPLSLSKNFQIRAEALVRLARNLRKAGRWENAVAAYEHLAQLESVSIHGIPTALLARGAVCDVLEEHRLQDRLRDEASRMYADLHNGRWHLPRRVYDVYAEQARRILGSEAAPAPLPETLAIAETVQSLWQELEHGETAPTRQTFWSADRSVLVVARRSADRVAALVAGVKLVNTWLPENGATKIILADAQDRPVNGRIDQHGSYSVRLPSASGLPWTIYALSIPPDSSNDAFSSRSRLVVAGLFAIAVLVVGGSYLIARAVARELAIARLQSDFVTAVSHEFRTPLTALRQLSELLAKGRVINDGVRQQYYEVLENESARLQRLVEGLLNFGRMEAGAMRYQFETIDTIELVRKVVEAFKPEADRRGCRVDLAVNGSIPTTLADREALGCVIWNLLDNAVKYSPDCNTVWVDVRSNSGSILIRVRDEGVGIPKEDQRRIFQKFVRSEIARGLGVQGAGIGLAVAQQIMATHGGEIEVESAPGAGSTFTVSLRAINS